jgi:hypothetical protein
MLIYSTNPMFGEKMFKRLSCGLVFKGFWVHTVVLMRHGILRVFVLSLSQAEYFSHSVI